jgi:transposase-like protein
VLHSDAAPPQAHPNKSLYQNRSKDAIGTWHLDKVFVKINGQHFYLSRAVDHDGELLE